MDTSSGCVSSERDFFGGLEDDDDPEELAGGPPDSDDIVLTVLRLTLVIDSNAHNVNWHLSTFTLDTYRFGGALPVPLAGSLN